MKYIPAVLFVVAAALAIVAGHNYSAIGWAANAVLYTMIAAE
ncbi:hypothetical protein [Rhodomicrobium udaipurense]|nr:hypothetical protein [Rhodomicrobium udaipurense]